MAKISKDIMAEIRSLCDHAGRLVDAGEYSFAASKYVEALHLVPDPKSKYDISTLIYASLGEAYWRADDYTNAGMAFLKALKCPGGDKIGKINFRLGQCLEECGERKKAQDYLCQAYLIDGEQVFESENPKYYSIIRLEIEGKDAEPEENIYVSDDYDVVTNILADLDTIKHSPDGTDSRSVYTADILDGRDFRTDAGGEDGGYSFADDVFDEDDSDDRFYSFDDYDRQEDYEDGPYGPEQAENQYPAGKSKKSGGLLSGLKRFTDLFK